MKKIFTIIAALILCISVLSGCFLDDKTANSTFTAAPAAKKSAQANRATADPSLNEPNIPGNLRVSFIDVGQGDSAFIELANGKTMLIDAGVSQAEDKIIQLIKDKGYSKIDYLVATHPHADHIGGMRKVVKSFKIGEIYMPKAATNTKTYEKLLTEISDKGLSIHTAKAGMTIQDGVEILAPNAAAYDDLNDYSIVIKITNGSNKFLFLGDTQILSENEILNAGFDVSADVVKVGHHGSGTSSGSEFVNAVHAKYAIFSVGDHNNYNHPHIFVVEKWKNSGAETLRTDEKGTITFISDGTHLTMQTEK